MLKKVFYIVFVIIIFGVAGFGLEQRHRSLNNSAQNNSTSSAKKITVVASFYPLAEFTRQVGKDLVEVHTLTPPGSEPHDFEPTPQDLIAVQQAQLLIYNGIGLETWVDKLDAETRRSLTMVKATEGIEVFYPHGSISGDPHVWMNPVDAQQEVQTIKNALVTIDPEHRAVYEQNAHAYGEELRQLDLSFQRDLAHCRLRDIVTSHDAFQYLAKQYGLRVVTIAGLSPDEEPSPQKLGDVARFVKEHAVRFIFFESLVSPKLAETIANETGAQTIAFNPLEGLTPAEIEQGKNYISVQRENIAALRTALQCE